VEGAIRTEVKQKGTPFGTPGTRFGPRRVDERQPGFGHGELPRLNHSSWNDLMSH